MIHVSNGQNIVREWQDVIAYSFNGAEWKTIQKDGVSVDYRKERAIHGALNNDSGFNYKIIINHQSLRKLEFTLPVQNQPTWTNDLAGVYRAIADINSWISYSSKIKDFYLEVAKGQVDGHELIHISGTNTEVDATISPVTNTGSYQTPNVAEQLYVVSNSTDDSASGSGARVVRIHGIGSDGSYLTEDVSMNGTTQVATANQYLRVYNFEVKESGAYASQLVGSHVGTIQLINSIATVWAEIGFNVAGFPLGTSRIGCYTIPTGKTAYILSFNISVDSNKIVNLYYFSRQNILQQSPPFSPMISRNTYDGINGFISFEHQSKEPFYENTDIGFMATVGSTTASVSVDIEMILVDNY